MYMVTRVGTKNSDFIINTYHYVLQKSTGNNINEIDIKVNNKKKTE